MKSLRMASLYLTEQLENFMLQVYRKFEFVIYNQCHPHIKFSEFNI